MRPLCRELHDGTLPGTTARNAGLWYDKFCNQWGNDPYKRGIDRWSLESFEDQGKKSVNPKMDWIKTLTSAAIGADDALTHAHERVKALAAAHGRDLMILQTSGPFVSGLGRSHPVENGFVWHHTLGVPYLPGSSVKGMVCAWVKHWWAGGNSELSGEDEQRYRRVFSDPKAGTPDDAKGVGTVIFLDALPVRSVQLVADIMTPHYAPYYQDRSGSKPPADWYSPIPIPFMVVAPGARFSFGLLPRNRHDRQHVDDCTQAERWLADAISQIGAGAKTAVGYGRFVPPADETSSNNARASSEAAAGTSHGKAAPSTTAPAKDELTLFREWFDRENFAHGQKKGQQDEIRKRVEKLTDPRQGTDYVRSKLKKKTAAPSVWAWLQEQRGDGDKQS